MGRNKITVLIAVFVLLAVSEVWLITIPAQGNVITLDAKKTFQTMSGWEATAWAGQEQTYFANYMDRLLDLAVYDLGINRLRVEVRAGGENTEDYWSNYQAGQVDYSFWRSHRYTTVNDNDDPYVINWTGYHFTELDNAVEKIVLPMKQRVEAKGEKLYINVNYVAFTGQNGPGLLYIHKGVSSHGSSRFD